MATPLNLTTPPNENGRTTFHHRPPANRPSFIPRRAAASSPLPGSNLSMFRDIQTANLRENTINTSNGHAIFNLVFPASANSSEGRSTNVPNEGVQARGVTNVESDTVTGAQKADYEIYYNQLLAKKRGSPLWVPGPGLQLPTAYRRRGVGIGDVGLIYCSGGFDFLFNIFLPADHPMHRGRVPEGFHALSFTEIEPDIEKSMIYGHNSYLASSTLHKTSGVDSEGHGMMFETSAREAAILVMPDGALTQNLLNLEPVREYIATNASRWYEYAKHKRGRSSIKNGDIRMVVGCDMVSCWGIATLASSVEQTARLEFRGSDAATPSQPYSWNCVGTSGSGRVGPQAAELRGLRQENGAIPLQNQCVFVRTMNLTFSGDTWSDTAAVHNHVCSGKDSGSGSLNHPSLGGSSDSQPSSAAGGSQSTHMHISMNAMQLGVSDVHPSTSLNRFLLEKHPNAKMVITQDADWISVLNEDDNNLPFPDELCARVCASYESYETNGVVTLKLKNPDLLPCQENIKQGLAADNAVFCSSQFHNFGTQLTSGMGLGMTSGPLQSVKLYRQEIENLECLCSKFQMALDCSSDHPVCGELLDELQAAIRVWASWSHLKTFLRQSDIRDGINRIKREVCLRLMNKSSTSENKGYAELSAVEEPDNSEVRKILRKIVANQEDMEELLSNSTAIDKLMEGLQTQLISSGLEPMEEEDFKACLWHLHEKTAKLPPLTCLYGQAMLMDSCGVIQVGSTSDTFQGLWLDKQKVALRLPKYIENSSVAKDRLEREVRLWRHLCHPNVIQLYGTTSINGQLYFVTPWMNNGVLPDYLIQTPSADRLKLLSEIASGLEYLHGNNIIHGDLRGANVLISKDAVACLCDFGLSQIWEGAGPSNSVSLRWAAPEVLLKGITSKHSDVWSFGMTGLEILSGEVPFYDKDDEVVRCQLIQGDLPHCSSSISANLNELSFEMKHLVLNSLLKCWAKVPEARLSMSKLSVVVEKVRVRQGFSTATVSPNITPILGGPVRADQLMVLQGKEIALRFGQEETSEWFGVHETVQEQMEKGLAQKEREVQPSEEELKREHDLDQRFRQLKEKQVMLVGNDTSPVGLGVWRAGLSNLPSDEASRPSPYSNSTSSSSCKFFPEDGKSSYISSTSSLDPDPGKTNSYGMWTPLPIHGALYEHKCTWKIDENGVMVAGTLNDLVQFLVMTIDSPKHKDYRDIFAMACAEVTTPDQLFEIIARRFQDAKDETSADVRVGQHNAFLVVEHWLELGYIPSDGNLRLEMQALCENAIQTNSEAARLYGIKNLRQLINQIVGYSASPSRIVQEGIPVAYLDPHGLAIALSRLEGENYQVLRPSDYVLHLAKRSSEKINRFYESNEKIKLWVIESILQYDGDDVHRRAEVMTYFIKTALECRDMRNFSSATAIISALYSTAIQRLKVTMKTLTRDKQGKLSALYHIVNPDSNYRGYWDTLNKSASAADKRGACIPWLRVHLIEMEKALHEHPMIIEEGGQELINLKRYTTFMARSNDYLHYRLPTVGDHPQEEQLTYLLAQLRGATYSEDTYERLLAVSAKLEGQGASNRRSRKDQMKQLGFKPRG